MRKDNSIFIRTLFLIALGALLVGCQQDEATTDQSTALAEVGSGDFANDEALLVEGRLVPRAVAQVSFAIPGTVLDVMVADGDEVESGQLLARLEGLEQASATVAAAELELLAAEVELANLTEGQEARENQAFLALVAARQAVWDAQQSVDELTGDGLTREVSAAEAQLVLAEERLESAEDDLADYDEESGEEAEEPDPARAALELAVAEAQRAYDAAQQRLDELDGERYDFLLQQARDRLAGAERERDLAEERYDDVLAGPDSDGVALATARVEATEAGLAAARAGLAAYELRAPLGGTVVDLTLRPGESVPAGQPVARVADFSTWLVETVDLTEFDVVAVEEGIDVAVTIDALPEVIMSGTVGEVSRAFREVRGEVTYVARIELTDPDPRLRWGMTALVTLER